MPGNMWDKGKQIYGSLPKKIRPRFKGGTQVIFPHGPEIKYTHMQHVSDKENIQGAELTFMGVDEACQFEWEQIEYMISRMRSPSKYNSRLILSCNPDPDHRLAELIDWYLDEEGYPDPEREGKIRYFLQLDDTFHWADTEEELHEQFDVYDEIAGDIVPCEPMSFTFISSTIYDNPVAMKANPRYLASLKALNKIDKARLLHGNWKLRPEGANYFSRDWVKKVDRVPFGASCCRAWDKAASEPTDVEPRPDFTASIKMYKDGAGDFYIVGDFCDDNMDKLSKTYGHFRKRPGARDLVIESQTLHDGRGCTVVMPQDPGAAGKTEYAASAKKLSHIAIVKKDPMPPTTAKLTRFSPFAAAAENGFVNIVEGSFRNKATLEAFYQELEKFDGERSTRQRKDDWPDTVASAFNFLSQQRVVRIVKRNQNQVDTLVANHIKEEQKHAYIAPECAYANVPTLNK